jgi:hypothetical protein
MSEWRAKLRASLPWLALALFSSLPLFVVARPPLQDLPFHLAAIRILHSLGDARYGFAGTFALNLGTTQYVLYHLLASALGWLVGIDIANRLLIAVYLGGTILAMRSLLRALGRDERLAIFVGPMLVNIMFIFGLLPFLFAIPFMVFALAIIARYYEAPSLKDGVAISILTIAMFYLHVFPLGLCGIGAIALFPWHKPKRWLIAAAPGAPVAVLIALWTFGTEAGRLARAAMFHPSTPSPLSPWGKLVDSFNWLGDTWRDHSDEVLWAALVLLIVTSTVIAWVFKKRPPLRLLRYAVVPVTCAVLFCIAGEQHANIWLIWQRFPLLFCLTMVPLLEIPDGRAGRVITALGVALAMASTVNTIVHFRWFQRDDVADFDDALAAMDPGKHVIGLIYAKESTVTWRHPLVHFVSYYQVEKGGVTEFTFIGFPHWPIHFTDGHCPPQGCQAPLDWEWKPEQVKMTEIHPYYDYVLSRGDGFDAEDKYRLKWRGHLWTVWERK